VYAVSAYCEGFCFAAARRPALPGSKRSSSSISPTEISSSKCLTITALLILLILLLIFLILVLSRATTHITAAAITAAAAEVVVEVEIAVEVEVMVVAVVVVATTIGAVEVPATLTVRLNVTNPSLTTISSRISSSLHPHPARLVMDQLRELRGWARTSRQDPPPATDLNIINEPSHHESASFMNDWSPHGRGQTRQGGRRATTPFRQAFPSRRRGESVMESQNRQFQPQEPRELEPIMPRYESSQNWQREEPPRPHRGSERRGLRTLGKFLHLDMHLILNLASLE
jgi:hypothetical protein